MIPGLSSIFGTASKGTLGTLKVVTEWDNSGLTKGAKEADRLTAKTGASLDRSLAKSTLAIAAIGTAAVGASTQLIRLGVKFEAATALIRRSTGATGKDLEALNKSFKNLYGNVANSTEETAKAIADVNTRLGLTGKELEGVAKTMLDLSRVTGESVESLAPSIAKVFRAFDVGADKQVAFMDKLLIASQHSGLAVGTLADHLTNAGLAFVELGYDLDKSIALFSEFERVGVNPQEILGALNIVVTRLAKEGFTDANEAFAELIRRIREAPDYLTATTIATDAFGARVAGKLADDIRAGRFEVDDLVASLGKSTETVAKAAAESETLGEKWAKMRHSLELRLEPLAGQMLSGFAWGLSAVAAPVEMVARAIAGIASALSKMPKEVWMVLGAGGALYMLPRILGAVGSALETVQLRFMYLGDAFKKYGSLTNFLNLGPAGLPIVGGLAALAGGLYLAQRHTQALKDSHDSAAEGAEKLAASLGLSFRAIEAGTVVLENATESTVAFTVANANLIKQIEALDTEAGKRALAIEVGFQMVAGGVSPDDALEAVQKLLDAAGAGKVSIGLDIDFGDIENLSTVIAERSREIASSIAASSTQWLNITPQIEEEIEALGELLGWAFSTDHIDEAIQGLRDFESQLASSGLSANAQAVIMRDLIKHFLEISGLSEHLGDKFSTLDQLLQAIADESIFDRMVNGLEEASDAVGDIEEEMHALVVTEDQLKSMTDALGKSYENVVDPLGAWNKVLGESKSAAEEAKESWDASKLSLKDYITELDKQIAAWDSFETNLKKLVETYGSEFGFDIIQEAAKYGPEFVEALAGADPQTVRETLSRLERIMGQNMDALANDLAALMRPVGTEASEEWSDAFDKKNAEAMRAFGQAVEKRSTLNLYASGKASMDSWMNGAQAGAKKSITIDLGISPAGGMDLMGLIDGKVPGLARTTGSVWTSLKKVFPFAQWMGGFATSGHVKGSDHYTGHAFDVGGTPAQMKAMADFLARNFHAWGLKQIIHNRMQNRGSGWYPYKGANPHTGHIHVGTYDSGGVLPPGTTLATNYTGGYEVVLPAGWIDSLTKQVDSLVQAIRDQVNADKEIKAGTKGTTAMERFMELFSSRMQVAESYSSREAARFVMQQAQGVDYAQQTETLKRQIEFINKAILEAQIQLDTAKKQHGSTPEQINELASNLFNLEAQAANARRELEAMARTPLEEAANRWSVALSQTQSMMSLLGHASNAANLQAGLMPTLMGQIGNVFQHQTQMMGMSTDPDTIMGYATAAISSISSMFSAEQQLINRVLSETLSAIDSQQRDWENAWRDRQEALSKSLTKEMDDLRTYYDDKLRLIDDRERQITRDEQRRRASKTAGGLEDELRILRGQGYYTEADIRRMRELESQLEEQRDAMKRQEEAWAREDERERLQRERDEAIASLQQQQQLQLQAMQEQLRAQQESFERQREQARRAAQQEIDQLVHKYQQMMQEVINRQNELMGQSHNYYQAGNQLGEQFASGLLAALPSIAAAAQTIAQQVSNILELHSPAKEGPLSTLDSWWQDFVPTLVQPLDTYNPARAAAVVAQGAKDAVGDRTVRVVFEGNAQNLDTREVARLVSRELQQDIEVRQWAR